MFRDDVEKSWTPNIFCKVLVQFKKPNSQKKKETTGTEQSNNQLENT
jgi:hypothetical protein